MDANEQGQIDDELYRIRHSLAHVMAQAVLEIRPGSTLGFGPPINDGFYYDFILSSPLSDEDLPKIEKKMRHIIKQGQKFEREDLPGAEALAKIDAMNEPYKREYAEALLAKDGIDSLSFYTNGPFLDMCEGPHVENTRKIPGNAFKLRSLAGAYWRGDSNNAMMTRIYAWAFKTREELDAKVKAYKEALARDHKKLGKEHDIFVIDDVIGKGLPLWLPNGTVIRDELEKLAKEVEFKAGYQRITTPHLAKESLYHQTGHLPYYAAHMYPRMELKEERETADGSVEEVTEAYYLKPMNCPHHHRVFAARKHSYKELPIRFAEYGDCYRYEDSGALSGLLRVRGMSMNDAHIYCTEDQIKDEFLAVMKMQAELYRILGLDDFFLRLSTWDPEDPKGKEKYIDNPEAWEKTQNLVREAMTEAGIPFTEVKGEAAFYGPKIDIQFKTVTGREETLCTNQLDFGIPERLGLVYTGADDKEHHPYVIHRAPLSTHERMVAFLIERFGAAFPTWLSPVQVRVLTVGERFDEYGRGVVASLRDKFIRAEIDESSDTVSKKVRNGAKRKIPNLLIIGEREMEDGTVTLRRRGVEEQKTMPVAELITWLEDAITTRDRTR